MRFALSSDHFEFFARNKYIEFADLLTQKEAEDLRLALDARLSKRLKIEQGKISNYSSEQLYLKGRNLWKEDPLIKRIIMRSQLAEIASLLFKKKPLRLAYDQYLRTGINESPFAKEQTLQEISSFTPVTGALILQLSECDALLPFPQKIGSGIFIRPDLALPLPSIFQVPNLSLFLMTYSPEKTLYALEKTDPLTHALKKEGYVFGDRLRNDTHPLVFR